MAVGSIRCRWSRVRPTALLAAAAAFASGAHALCLWPGGEEGALRTPGGCPEYGFVQWSRSNRSAALAAGVLWPWRDAPRLWPGRLTWQIEATVGAWRSLAVGDAGEPHVSLQLGLKPAARWDIGSGWFLEAGIGLNVVTPRYRGGDRRFSTLVNFGDHIALGLRLGDRQEHELQLRVEHFSNAGLRGPNPGENFGQVRYVWRF